MIFTDFRGAGIGKNVPAGLGAALATARKALRGLHAAEIGRLARKAPKTCDLVHRRARFLPKSRRRRNTVQSVLFCTKRRGRPRMPVS
ncbi:hypothetical protein, partial [Burkholderia sp. Ac-20379]|uniref:hypothetical protein n=1 Tax=Burkholderia sp. Ac-20379 TaxID=2703900 RepID=UPI0030D90F8F